MLPKRSGFTLVEALIVIAIAGILSTIAFSGMKEYLARQGARNARDEFVYMAARARAAAIERSQVVRLEISPDEDRVRIVTSQNGVEKVLETRHYTGEFNAVVTTGNGETLTICYSPRGYASTSCTSISEEVSVDFARAGKSARAVVRPLGQVFRR
jgi:prepilin-type N-terminal cleavage/methylation domain-containing protein